MSPRSWLAEAVGTFGSEAKKKLAGPGDREAAIRSPLETLLKAAGDALGVPAVFHDEVRDTERQVRPDYGVSVGGAIVGYLEVKAPGTGVDPDGFSGHNLRQWERQRDLPNLVYTDGTQWRLYRDGELSVGPVFLTGGTLASAGSALVAPPELETLLTDFLRWKPASITSVRALVRAVAPLTRLLRGEVEDQLVAEREAVARGADRQGQPFSGLAKDWRRLLFPTADDSTFADGYAQAVTFALLLARSEGIDLTGGRLHQVGKRLGDRHSLMGRALQLLTDDVAADFRVTLDLLVRVVGAVQWERVRKGRRDTYLHLYEHFLEEYDHELRKQSGSYYTPREVVNEMVRLAEEVLVQHLGRPQAFRDPDVQTVDPAMGTGTYLQTILERVSRQVEEADGEGAIGGALQQVAEHLYGFELQLGPYAVAEMRAADLLRREKAETPPSGMRFYVTDTLDDPDTTEAELGYQLEPIARSRRQANKVKRHANVTVCIGNPPYRERAEGQGGWVESGSLSAGAGGGSILDDFRHDGNGRYEYVLKNLYVYFWRWATWKVWESTPDDLDDGHAGVVCFISTAGYLRGPGFRGMREYLRRHASDGWVIDLTPEGQTPDVPTRIFPGVRQPLAIGIFVRNGQPDAEVPARIRYRSLAGRQADKFRQLTEVSLGDDGWREARTAWIAPFASAPDTDWDAFPAAGDLFPWVAPGVKPNRTWVYSPSRAVLAQRWTAVVTEPDLETKKVLFKETSDTYLSRRKAPLRQSDTHDHSRTLGEERGAPPTPARVGYRTLDRHWLLPDSRLLHRESPDLWAARHKGQVFLVEQHSKPLSGGPGLVFSALIPDMDHFKGSEGGRVLPLLHPNGAPNVAPRLLATWGAVLGREVTPHDLLAYVAGVVSHPVYTETFVDELTTPGVRVPLTGDPALLQRAVAVGQQVVWLYTYGEAFAGDRRPAASVRYLSGDPRQPLCHVAVTGLPDGAAYDEDAQVVRLGTGVFGPVRPEVWGYEVGGKNVIRSWVNYRKAKPGGKKTSPLDHLHVDAWEAEWTTELVDLLTVLTQLVDLEQEQADLLGDVLAGPLVSRGQLAEAGVQWPTTRADRSARFDALPSTEEGQLDLGW